MRGAAGRGELERRKRHGPEGSLWRCQQRAVTLHDRTSGGEIRRKPLGEAAGALLSELKAPPYAGKDDRAVGPA